MSLNQEKLKQIRQGCLEGVVDVVLALGLAIGFFLLMQRIGW